jgi:hypothetical protein
MTGSKNHSYVQKTFICQKKSFLANWRLRKLAIESQVIVRFCLSLSKTGHSSERFSETALLRKTIHSQEELYIRKNVF